MCLGSKSPTITPPPPPPPAPVVPEVMVSPEEHLKSSAQTAAAKRASGRRGLRIDLAPAAGSGLNIPGSL